MQFLTGSALRNVKLLADLFHMNIEEANLAGRASARPGRTSATSTSPTRTARPPGWATPTSPRSWRRFARSGYEGYLSAEVMPLPDSDAAAKQTIESFGKLMA